MKNISKILFIIILAVIIFSLSCKKPAKISIIPSISFQSFTKDPNSLGYDNKGTLTLNFTDGDGDIGLNPDDTSSPYNFGSPYYNNLFVIYYEKQHGHYVAVNLPATDSARIPYVTPMTGENKAIQGIITDDLYINNYTSPFDTIAFDVSICDRALHISNVVRTPDIIIIKKP